MSNLKYCFVLAGTVGLKQSPQTLSYSVIWWKCASCLLGMLNVRCLGRESWVWTVERGEWVRGDASRGWRDAAPHPRDGRSAPPAIFHIMSLMSSSILHESQRELCTHRLWMYARCHCTNAAWAFLVARWFVRWGREESRGLATSPWRRSSLLGCVSRAAPT